jgi:hypothetical protein
MNTNVTQPTQVQAEDPIKTTLQPELPMIQRVLNNLANNDTIPDDTLKMLSKKYGLKKPAIQAWIVENKKWIKDADFTEGQ